MTDLDAIRARDAKTGDFDIYTTSPDEGDKVVWAFADRRDLLAEVDRLTEENADLYRKLAYAGDEVRARIRAAMMGLPERHAWGECVDRAIVARMLEETT